MKIVNSLFVMLWLSGLCFAQKPETVYGLAQESKSVEWYKEQEKLWKIEIDKNEKNATAWFNYYKATRALRYLTMSTDYDEFQRYNQLTSEIVDKFYELLPNSFEANLLKYTNGGLSDIVKDEKYLMKAREIAPNDSRGFREYFVYFEVKNNKEELEKTAVQIFQHNDFPVSVLNWGYNLLAELDENAILFTAGDNDTYAAWIVQYAKNFRKDVKVFNTSLVSSLDDYCAQMLSELGIEKFKKPFPEPKTEEENQQNWEMLVQHIFNSGYPVYTAVSAIQQFEDKWGDKLYLTGLAYRYSENPIDNISIIRRNYEHRFLTDYLKEHFAFNKFDNIADRMNATYLPSLLKLYTHYLESEDVVQSKRIEELIKLTSDKSGQQSEIQEALGQTVSAANFLSTFLDVKQIEKNQILLKDKVYLSKYETSNAEYRHFLENLSRSKQFDLVKVATYDSSLWVSKFPNAHNDPMKNLYHSNSAYDRYPAVNISFDAAKAYCQWLTHQYNMQRKRRYTQVLFRLPTEQEWIEAATSRGKYPVSGFPDDKIKNEKECYLVNLKAGDEYAADGSFHTATVDSYLHNELGFFNMFGNVAEMTSKKGIAKGGSWYNTFEESKFKNNIKYDGADPGIGFRIVMEVIVE